MKWYKHFSKMRLDTKIKRLIGKYGITGYGVYNYILECIAFNLDPESPIPEIEEGCHDLANEMKIDTIKLEEIINFCLGEKLFEINPENKRIMCLKLLSHLDNTLSNNPEIKNILNNFKKLQETSRNFKQIRLDKIRLDKINIDKNKIDKEERNNKIISKIQYLDIVFLSEDEYNKLITEYTKVVIDNKISDLNDYLLSIGKPKKYKSHYHTIITWLKKDNIKKDKEKIKNKNLEVII